MTAHGQPIPQPIPMTARRGAGRCSGVAHVPGDKSICHRALILGALMRRRDPYHRPAGRARTCSTPPRAMRAFGAEVDAHGRAATGVCTASGVGGFAEPEDVIDCGNSGTGVRLIMGAMATSPITATFTGDASLRSGRWRG